MGRFSPVPGRGVSRSKEKEQSTRLIHVAIQQSPRRCETMEAAPDIVVRLALGTKGQSVNSEY